MKVGDVLEGWRLEALLHDGSKSRVFVVTNADSRRALKWLKPEAAADIELSMRFFNEARAIHHVTNDHVVKVFDFGVRDDDSPYMRLELVEGLSLARLIASGGPMDAALAIELGLQICEGVAAIHASGFLHRNLEPTNILVERHGKTPQIKIIDLLFARTLEPASGPRTGNRIIGTAPYAAPEQLRDPRLADPRSDVWSIGAIVAFMMSGQPVLSGGGLPALARCLAPNPDDRFGSVLELAAALRG